MFDEALVLQRHRVKYYRCNSCGFIQTEQPYWLDEAYSSAIAGIDIGTVERAMRFAYATRCLILLGFDRKGVFLDFGGGYGMFVRRMRDLGFDFRYFDQHCENLFALGHEVTPTRPNRFELVTAFEVAEHLSDPLVQFQALREVTDNIFFSTIKIPKSIPKVGKWWYYAPEQGQHISFFSRQALEALAKRLDTRLYTFKDLHLLSTAKLPDISFRLATSQDWAPPIGHLLARRHGVDSLLPDDFVKLSGKTF